MPLSKGPQDIKISRVKRTIGNERVEFLQWIANDPKLIPKFVTNDCTVEVRLPPVFHLIENCAGEIGLIERRSLKRNASKLRYAEACASELCASEEDILEL